MTPAAEGAPRRQGRTPWFYRLGKQLLQALYDRALSTGPLLPADDHFPAHAELLRLTPLLQQQTRALALEALPRFHEVTSSGGPFAYRDGRRWSVLPLRLYGSDLPANQARLPALIPFLRAHPEVTSAMVSCLESGKHIRPHRGPFRGVLRYHLTLHCPSGDADHDCRLRVADHWIPYREGEDLLWDDTFEHEVINRTAADRVGLLLDVRRSGLPPHLALITAVVIRLAGWHFRRQRRRIEAASAPIGSGP
jgi:aspartate beta-hydroxylase